MKSLHLILCATVAFSLIGCGNPSSQSTITADSVQIIRIAPETKTLTQKQLFDSIGIVKLETTGKNLIGQVTDLLLTDSLMVITDKYTQAIQIYDRNGHFLRRIGNQGKSSREYIEFAAVAITPDQRKIAVADVQKAKILFYSIPDGQFIGSKDLPYNIQEMQYLTEGGTEAMALYSPMGLDAKQTGRTLIVTDTGSMNIRYGGFPTLMTRDDFTYSYNAPLKQSGTQVFLAPNLSDTIFQVTAEQLISRYAIQIETDPVAEWQANMTTQQYMDLRAKHTSFSGQYADLTTACWIQVSKQNRVLNYFYAKSTNQTYRLEAGIGSGDPLALFFSNPIAVDGDRTLVCALPAERLDDCLNLLSDKQRAQVSDRQPADARNPVLLFFHVCIQESQQ